MIVIIIMLIILLALVTVKCFSYKISLMAVFLYIEENGGSPSDAVIGNYIEKVVKRLFHKPR